MIRVKYPVAVISVFLWMGFVCAISFLEAWLKFKAPGITVSLGLSIGRLVFSALNKIEWVFAVSIISNILLSKGIVFSGRNLFYFLPCCLLIVQTIWLLPALDARAQLYMQQQPVMPSLLHFYYIVMEVLKVISLFIFGIILFK